MESERILSQANAAIENTIRKIKESQADKEKTKAARQELQKRQKENDALTEKKHEIDLKIERIRQREKPKKESVKSPEEPLFKVGQNVRIKGQSNVGSILEVKGESATIAFGFLKTSVQLNKLEVVSKNQIKKEQKKSVWIISVLI